MSDNLLQKMAFWILQGDIFKNVMGNFVNTSIFSEFFLIPKR